MPGPLPRIHYVPKARRPQGPCERCGGEIAVGHPYRWVRRGRCGHKQVRCMSCPCWSDRDLGFKVARLLTPRRTQVLDLLAAGGTNEEIAAALGICVASVKAHLQLASTALEARNRVHLAVLWDRRQRRARGWSELEEMLS